MINKLHGQIGKAKEGSWTANTINSTGEDTLRKAHAGLKTGRGRAITYGATAAAGGVLGLIGDAIVGG